MKYHHIYFKSKVAEKLLILFVFAAIIPVAVTGYFSYKFVTNLLVELKSSHLSSASKSYGNSIFDRIVIAEDHLNNVVIDIVKSNKILIEKSKTFLTVSDISNKSYFNKINVYRNPANINANELQHLLEDKSSIDVYKKIGSIEIVFRKLFVKDNITYLLSASADSNYIFGDMDLFAGDEDTCVIVKSVGILNCSNNRLNDITLTKFNNLIENDNKDNSLTLGNEAHIVASWELFLAGSYQAESWYIFYIVPSNSIYEPIKSFANILLPLLLLSVLIIAWFSYKKITKILTPLEVLTETTKRIAKRDFSEVINFNSDDEFQTLGDSFNLMSQELSRQFTIMTSMSNLDRALLTTMDKIKVIEAIFNNLKEYHEYDYASIMLIEDRKISIGNLYEYDKMNKKILSIKKINFHEEEINLLFNNADTYVQTSKRNKLKSISWIDCPLSNYITSIAIKQNGKILAFILIGHQYIPRLDQKELEQLENYTDRLNIALSAIEREEKLVKQANFDELTGLPNRQNLANKFHNIISADNFNSSIAVLFIDLDRFKIINDSQGHVIGDKLLVEASKRIQTCVQNLGYISRYGGDEFVVLLTIDNDSSKISKLSDLIINELSRIFTIDNYEQLIGASVGIAQYPQDGKNWDEVLQKADIAMYKAKQKGRSRYLFFSDTMHADIKEKATLEADLFHSLEKNEIYLVYQPQIEIATGQITGAETLMRWNHGTKGNIRPDQFIPYAEDSGFITQLGIWAMRTAFMQCQEWHISSQTIPKLAINISPKQLRHENFIIEVEYLLSNFDIGSTQIEFEITESLFLNDDISILSKLHHLNKLGISISIDDFGKGYSSLSYLKKLPVQTLKIDKLFINDISNDNDTASIVKAIIAMAKTLNKTVVAEGVETIEQFNILNDLDCDIAQGYFISKPKTADKIMDFSETEIIRLDEMRAKLKAIS